MQSAKCMLTCLSWAAIDEEHVVLVTNGSGHYLQRMSAKLKEILASRDPKRLAQTRKNPRQLNFKIVQRGGPRGTRLVQLPTAHCVAAVLLTRHLNFSLNVDHMCLYTFCLMCPLLTRYAVLIFISPPLYIFTVPDAGALYWQYLSNTQL